MKIKLTKSELKKQKEDLRRFNRYLPMLQLKEKQLQSEIEKIHHQIERLAREIDILREQVVLWADVFAENIGFQKIFKVKRISTDIGNVAGVDIPLFLDIEFDSAPYDLILLPLWVDKAVLVCRQNVILKAKITLHHKQIEILKEELRITTQRVNLFEKIKIPQAQGNIRVINIYTGELQKAAVVRGKIAKTKISRNRSVTGSLK